MNNGDFPWQNVSSPEGIKIKHIQKPLAKLILRSPNSVPHASMAHDDNQLLSPEPARRTTSHRI